MKTLAIMNQKGGVGKTTTAVTLGHGLALQGYSALIVDLDAQGNVGDALGLTKEPGLYNLLIAKAGEQAITSSGRPNLDLVLGDKRTVEAKQLLITEPFREQILRQALKDFNGYHYIILDVAPGVDVMQVSALVAADAFLIPVALDHLAVVGASDAMTSAAHLKRTGGLEARFLGLLPTFWERTTNESHQQLKALAAQFKRLLWPPIPRDTKAREAPAHGQTLWEYAPTCRALDGVKLRNGDRKFGGYRQVLDRIIQDVGP
jgi:chromosome partitioning protein